MLDRTRRLIAVWPVTASRTVYDNDWIEVVEDDVVRPDGSAASTAWCGCDIRRSSSSR